MDCLFKTFFIFFIIYNQAALSWKKNPANEAISCPQSFQSYDESTDSPPMKIESYDETLVRLARFHLGVDDLNQGQIEALKNYHAVVRGEEGEDKTLARAGNYTLGQIRRIIRFLEEEFSREQVRTLIEDGVVEIDRFYLDAIITKRVVRKLRGGKTIFASVIKIKGMDSNQNITIDSPMKIKKLIEETDNGLLVEVEMIDSNGRLYTTQKFILKEFLRDPFGLTAAKIVERTDSGFVIGINTIYERRVGFLSFERAIENGFLPKNPTAQDYSALEGLFFSALEDQNDYINAAKNKIISNSFDMEQQYGSLQNLLTKVLIPGINVRIENPEFEFIFLAANSNREKISLDELNLLPTTSEEAWLAEQGYKDGFIGGLEETNERIAVRRRLQELKANPRKTHVEYFAKLILDYIAHIRQGLVDIVY